VTRSLGDQDVKMDGLTATPEVFIRELTEDDEFLVLACDGLWDTLSNEAVVSIVQVGMELFAPNRLRIAGTAGYGKEQSWLARRAKADGARASCRTL
jgi:serine/threonine protein phosphatase PrpC